MGFSVQEHLKNCGIRVRRFFGLQSVDDIRREVKQELPGKFGHLDRALGLGTVATALGQGELVYVCPLREHPNQIPYIIGDHQKLVISNAPLRIGVYVADGENVQRNIGILTGAMRQDRAVAEREMAIATDLDITQSGKRDRAVVRAAYASAVVGIEQMVPVAPKYQGMADMCAAGALVLAFTSAVTAYKAHKRRQELERVYQWQRELADRLDPCIARLEEHAAKHAARAQAAGDAYAPQA